MEMYVPAWRVQQEAMEEFDSERFNNPGLIGKYTKGIGQKEFRFATDDEDPVSMAMTTLHRLMDRVSSAWGESAWMHIGRLEVGTESAVDRSKSIKSYLMELFERYGKNTDIEGSDTYHACYGGTSAMLGVVNWLQSNPDDRHCSFWRTKIHKKSDCLHAMN